MPKLTCLSYRPNDEFRGLNCSFDQGSSNLMHECTRWIFHVKSPRKMFWSKIKSLSWVLDDKWNASHGELVDPMESSMKKNLKLGEICYELKWRSEWKYDKRSSWSVMEVLFIQSFGFRWNFFLERLLDPF